ncbi:putative bifunctional diguanylate cyclase/phosphodiesterase [Hyphomonas sp.]|uniref:putative bifunctional diguanylate cyclase/phosphodiesterase n=1 Tax=Hyphomonas sp. TaxID=87 RepID=UPI0039191F8A
MLSVKRALATLVSQYRLNTDDKDLCRAQFREFVHQVPLMYFIVSWNAVALAFTFRDLAGVLLSCGLAIVLCAVSAVRGIWWIRNGRRSFTDAEIIRTIRMTGILAILLTGLFTAWGVTLYPYGDLQAKAHLTFFLALTQISAVFCLFPLRSAALSVATVATVPFFLFFSQVDDGMMLPVAIMQTLVSAGMVVNLYKYNITFSKLITSRKVLRHRQLEAQRLSDENRKIAFSDPLTGMPNRRALLSRLEEITAAPRECAGRLAMAFIDLDGFKEINDVHGHQLGDELITEVGRRLCALRDEGAMLARMGGDEFAVLFEGEAADAQAARFSDEALRQLAEPVRIADRLFQIGASIGIAVDTDGVTGPFELLRRADTAMYAVKANGKRGVQVYEPGLDEGSIWRRRIEQEIAEGLGRSEFDVVYQPIVDARTQTAVCVEALVRWPGRPDGPLSPDEFIGIAEGSGSIQALGMYVLERACRETRGIPGLRLSVNVAPTQFKDPDFCNHVREILDRTGFDPERLQLEITERHLIDYPERASAAIDALRAIGVRFALDDFGTGFTSIAYLQSFGFGCVKIDRSLTSRLESDPKAGFLIAGLIQMARGLDVSVVVEGVETARTAALLKTAGCRELQGYYFGRPGPLEGVLETQVLMGDSAVVA